MKLGLGLLLRHGVALLALPVASLLASPDGGAGLLRNGGFEAPFATGGLAPAWQDDSAWAAVHVVYGVDTVGPASGRQAQRIECLRYEHGSVRFQQRGLAVEAGHVYRVRLALRGELDSPVEVQLRHAGPPYTLYATSLLPVGATWKSFDFTVVAAGSDPSALFNLQFCSTGTLWVDDVSVVDLGPAPGALELTPPPDPIPPEFFGMHSHREERFPTVPFKSWRLWDSGVSWPQLEPGRGEWDFRRLDARVEQAQKLGIEILLPLGLTPKWASARPDEPSAYNKRPDSGNATGWAAEPVDLADWRQYVSTVAKRYRGRIRHYEIWNEVNEKKFFSGTIGHLIELQAEAWRILKEVDPANQVLSPSVVANPAFFARLLDHGILRWCDVAAYHYYNFEQPEHFVPVLQILQRLIAEAPGLRRPLWNTESGWYISSEHEAMQGAFGNNREAFVLLNPEEASAYVARSSVLYWALGTQRWFFYAWDNGRMGLCEKDGTPKPAARAYAEIQHWMIGKRMASCRRDADGVWCAELETADGMREAIVWSPNRESTWEVPSDLGAQSVRHLDGSIDQLTAAYLKVDFSPVLLGSSP